MGEWMEDGGEGGEGGEVGEAGVASVLLSYSDGWCILKISVCRFSGGNGLRDSCGFSLLVGVSRKYKLCTTKCIKVHCGQSFVAFLILSTPAC